MHRGPNFIANIKSIEIGVRNLTFPPLLLWFPQMMLNLKLSYIEYPTGMLWNHIFTDYSHHDFEKHLGAAGEIKLMYWRPKRVYVDFYNILDGAYCSHPEATAKIWMFSLFKSWRCLPQMDTR